MKMYEYLKIHKLQKAYYHVISPKEFISLRIQFFSIFSFLGTSQCPQTQYAADATNYMHLKVAMETDTG